MDALYALRSTSGLTPEGGALIVENGKIIGFLPYQNIRDQYGQIPILELESGKYLDWNWLLDVE